AAHAKYVDRCGGDGTQCPATTDWRARLRLLAGELPPRGGGPRPGEQNAPKNPQFVPSPPPRPSPFCVLNFSPPLSVPWSLLRDLAMRLAIASLGAAGLADYAAG